MNTTTTGSLFQQVIEVFQSRERLGEPTGLTEIRQQAFQKFSEAGFPTVKNEDWKYTNIQPLVNKPYALADDSEVLEISVDKALIPELDAYRIVLTNGQHPQIDTALAEIDGLVVDSIGRASHLENFEKYFAKHADKTDNPFVYLNTALYTSGLFIEVSKNVVVDKPIHIVHVAAGAERTFAQTRNLFVIAANAEVEIIESFISQDAVNEHLANKVTEIVLDENAKVQHYYVQISDEQSNYVNHIEVYQAQHSLYNNYNCTFPGAAFVRNNINVRLDAEQVESHLYGINLLAGKQLVDNHTIVDHLKPHCESYEWYKNIPQENATAVFNGKIFVREDAQKTNAFQQNNNMLIGDHATIYTKPQLEIFADDVKCSHGCTMGQFDDNALFYLRARGIGEESARTLLVHAFAFDVTSRFSNEAVKNYVEDLVAKGLEV